MSDRDDTFRRWRQHALEDRYRDLVSSSSTISSPPAADVDAALDRVLRLHRTSVYPVASVTMFPCEAHLQWWDVEFEVIEKCALCLLVISDAHLCMAGCGQWPCSTIKAIYPNGRPEEKTS